MSILFVSTKEPGWKATLRKLNFNDDDFSPDEKLNRLCAEMTIQAVEAIGRKRPSVIVSRVEFKLLTKAITSVNVDGLEYQFERKQDFYLYLVPKAMGSV